MAHPSQKNLIFHFSNIKDFLNEILANKKVKNPKFSIRTWAKRLGQTSPSLLVNVLKGNRKVSVEFGNRIADSIELTETERRYFNILILQNLSSSPAEHQLYNELLEHLRPDPNVLDLKLEDFKYISDWHHLALLEMLSLKNFKEDPKFLAKRLGDKISPEKVAHSLQLLRAVGLINLTQNQIVRAPGNMVLKDNVPSEAIRSHHKQLMQRAIEALSEQSLDERDFRSSKFAIRYENYQKAVEIIKEFHKKMQKISTRTDGDDVYAFNTQFFKLTVD
jgi:uncharacterized protein (TIGR02147 family)